MAFQKQDLTKEIAEALIQEYRIDTSSYFIIRYAIDQERHAKVIEKAPVPLKEGGKFYILWNKQKVTVEATRHNKREQPGVYLHIHSIIAPRELEPRAEEMIELILDALASLQYWPSASPDVVDRVAFAYIATPKFVNEESKTSSSLSKAKL